MSDETATPGADQAPLIINGQYIKDLSFEVPNAPRIFAELDGQPEVPINVDVTATPVGERFFEVSLKFRIEGRIKGKVAFIAELDYCAVATVNLPDEHIHPVLLIEVPRLMFPFARNILADLTRDGGFPPLMIQPLDFAAMYRNRVQAAQSQATAENAAAN
ncbi:protein-export chaperone SecB [Rhodospirillum rubrum]|uniref:protein-export chaperone SecB n=1 Tax=Rhodospirillum rubrum TaxID=1085 RepID=UPI001903277D|nr:protein-export chaperone SecB [Rhodospirillum rubrum]MBK1663216.1 protein-export chaperone SecB [Rhodospirillum rubrum]MBK1676955.1 protein-export chaperone SecB [Rhodospirillum rubrum]